MQRGRTVAIVVAHDEEDVAVLLRRAAGDRGREGEGEGEEQRAHHRDGQRQVSGASQLLFRRRRSWRRSGAVSTAACGDAHELKLHAWPLSR